MTEAVEPEEWLEPSGVQNEGIVDGNARGLKRA